MNDDKVKVPIFDGHYEHWSEMMEILLRAKQVWNLIDPGIREPTVGVAQSEAEKKKLEELRMKDLQVKHYLYQAIDRVTFEQILDRKTSKAVWESMRKRFAGNDRVKKSMLQKLRRDFEVIEMKANETIPEYFGRVLTISNQMRSNGESMADVKIVEKILRTLTERYTYVVVSIEESKDIEKMSIEELQSTLIVHEQKFKKGEREEEQALRVDAGDSSNTIGRGRGRHNFRGRGRGRGRQSFNKETIECYNCHKLGHYSYECPNAKEANYAGFDANEEIMLMADGGEGDSGCMVHVKRENKGLLWFLDSGCSNHMCGDKGRFVDLDQSFSNTVKLGNNTRMKVEGKGNMKLILNGITFVIKDVYFVPELKNNLLSIGQLQQKGLSFLFQSGMCKVFHQDRGLIFQSSMSSNRMYPLNEDASETTEQITDECMYSNNDGLGKLWHERLGHISKTSMKTLQHKEMVRDLPEFIIDTSVCKDCMVGKQTKEAIPRSSSWRAEEILELVHSDICGPINPISNTGKKYFLSFIDDYSRKGWVYLLTEKSQALESFKDFKDKVEKETGKVVKALRTDRGGEYLSNEFSKFCREHGIRRQLTTSFTPQQNGVTERKNRTVINMVVTLLSAKNMPKMFWAEATVWSFYVLNRSTTKALSDITPQEAWSGLKPTVSHFRVWGCLAHVHIPKEKRTKLDNKSCICVLTGVSEESKAYRLINPETMKVVISKDVVFEEHKGWDWSQGKKVQADDEDLSWGNYDFTDDYIIINDHGAEVQDLDESDQVTNDPGPSNTLAREGRQRRPPSYLQDYVTGDELDSDEEEANMMKMADQDPVYYDEAIKEPKWKIAMDREIEMIEKNETWSLVDLPKEAKCIGVKWVFKTKLNEKGEVQKHKARLVARGYGQEYGIDYLKVYAPVARMDTIRLMLALAAQRDWSIYQMDVKSAFLHGTLQEDVYVQQPQGYVVKDNEQKVYKLHKALYGLKQAPRAWYSRIEAYFVNEGFTRSRSEHTLFIKQEGDKLLFVNIYVDDLLFTGNDEKMMEDFKVSMKSEFEMTDLGKMRYFLGIEVIQNSAGIHISQRKYAVEMLTRFKMMECNAVVNPMVPGCRLSHDEGEPVDETLFKQLVGSLMYITITRPDVQFVVSYISRFMSKPTESHFAAAKRVLRYIQGTLDYGIWYKRKGKGKMEIFTDSDFAGDLTDRKSTSGYAVLWDGAAVSWSSKKQSIVALSSTEAEYVAAASCACQVVWIREILEEMGMQPIRGSVIKCDNTSAIQLSRNPVFHGRCKHIGVRFHFLRELVGNGTVRLEYVETKEQVADILTKPLHRDTFERLRDRLGVCSLKGKHDNDTGHV
ncbi:hypothetical protein L2E82_19506 [Cichorium intybus]|uniref:Uncharacterized protein n=1 Tax=Cichorium intybus TaxID=13427 RepID=A0ACB9FCU9_CICIN|nr:hypothetical protein L2E82_19506 [Cichorium intybus]